MTKSFEDAFLEFKTYYIDCDLSNSYKTKLVIFYNNVSYFIKRHFNKNKAKKMPHILPGDRLYLRENVDCMRFLCILMKIKSTDDIDVFLKRYRLSYIDIPNYAKWGYTPQIIDYWEELSPFVRGEILAILYRKNYNNEIYQITDTKHIDDIRHIIDTVQSALDCDYTPLFCENVVNQQSIELLKYISVFMKVNRSQFINLARHYDQGGCTTPSLSLNILRSNIPEIPLTFEEFLSARMDARYILFKNNPKEYIPHYVSLIEKPNEYYDEGFISYISQSQDTDLIDLFIKGLNEKRLEQRSIGEKIDIADRYTSLLIDIHHRGSIEVKAYIDKNIFKSTRKVSHGYSKTYIDCWSPLSLNP